VLDYRGIAVSIAGRDIVFFLLHSVQTGSGTQSSPSLLSRGCLGVKWTVVVLAPSRTEVRGAVSPFCHTPLS
jgi:hypothetical protein